MNTIDLYKEVIDVIVKNPGAFCQTSIEIAKSNPKLFLDAAASSGIISKLSILDNAKKNAEALIRSQGFMSAIKYVRGELGISLKDAKDFCDKIKQEKNIN